eukprot:g2902.t1
MGRNPLSAAGDETKVRVLIVRHGESTNNVTMRRIYSALVGGNGVGKVDMGSATAVEAEAEWLAHRSTDPALTKTGRDEAAAFARHYAPLLREASPSGVRVYVSPFLRTCDTALPLVRALGARAKATLRADICEVGGVYTSEPASDGRPPARTGPGACMSADELRERFPQYSGAGAAEARWGNGDGVDRGWWRAGWEDDAAAWARAERVAAWLRSAELRDELRASARTSGAAAAGGALPVVVLVTHGAFIDLLLKALLRIPPSALMLPTGADPRVNQHYTNGALKFANTATAVLAIQPDGAAHALSIGNTEHLPVDRPPAAASIGVSASALAAGVGVGVVLGMGLCRATLK